MSAARQIRAVTWMGLRGIPARLGTSLVIIIGVATVVAVLVGALTIAWGFAHAAAKTGDPDRAMVLNGDTEANSGIPRNSSGAILDAPGVRFTSAGRPIASVESMAFVSVVDQRTGLNAYATVRGVGPEVLALRPEVRIVQGRLFSRGAREIIVGRALQGRLGGMAIGSGITLPNGDWKVVGVFSSGGDSHESEFWMDAESLLNAYHHNQFNSVTVALVDPDAFDRFSAALSSNPTLAVKAQRETAYFAAMSAPVSRLLRTIAYGIGGIMAFGAVFGALNTMYSAVSTRTMEIATLRAIGFGATAVVLSVLAEALALGLAGACLGALIVWLLLEGSTMSTMTGVTPSQLTFTLAVTPRVLLIGMVFALIIAAIGGLFASVRAARIPVAAALRAI